MLSYINHKKKIYKGEHCKMFVTYLYNIGNLNKRTKIFWTWYNDYNVSNDILMYLIINILLKV